MSERHERPRWLRLASSAMVLAGVLSVGAGALGIATAHAAGAVGSGLGSLSLNASAAAIRSPFYSHAGEDVEAEVPWSSSGLQSGGVGRAITSVYWPGDTGGHGGDTLYLLGVPCLPPNPGGAVPVPVPCVYQPPQPPGSVYQALNDPYKAEAQTGTGKPTVTNSGPGVDMRATATPADVNATTDMSGSKAPSIGDTFGKTTATTRVHLVGADQAVADAMSTVHNVSLGGGAITIASVASVAHATTNGTVATGTASTVVSGMKIAGTPVVVDDKGIHVAGHDAAGPSTDALNQALKSSGFRVYVAKPSRTVNGAGITLDSGNLVIMQTNSGYSSSANDTGRVLVFGGAAIDAAAGKGFALLSVPGAPLPPGPGPAPGSAPGAGALPGAAGSGAAPQVAGAQPAQQSPQLAAADHLLPGGVPVVWVALVVVGSALMGLGLRRLPDRVLAATGAACPLEGD